MHTAAAISLGRVNRDIDVTGFDPKIVDSNIVEQVCMLKPVCWVQHLEGLLKGSPKLEPKVIFNHKVIG